MEKNRLTWNEYFLNLAREASTRSKDPSTQVGAVIVGDKNQIISVGYNGFPRKIKDSEERLKNREIKYKYIIHAEINAILNVGRSVEGFTLYTWPFQPCADCTKLIIQAGIKKVLAPKPNKEILDRWGDSIELSQNMFYEAEVELIII